MMSLCHVWGWLPPQTASPIHLRHIQCVWAHLFAVHWHMVAALSSYPPYLAQILGFWVTCGVNMMSLHHSWGWQPPHTASNIHIRHIQSVWVHCYAVHGRTVSALHRYPPYLAQILGLWVTCGVKMMWSCHGWGWQPHLKLLPTSILDIYNVFEHFDMLSIGIW
jgi:hypothetical protein